MHIGAQQVSSRTLIAASYYGAINVGATLTFFNFDTFATLAKAKVLAVETREDAQVAADVIAFTAKQGMKPRVAVRLTLVTLDRDVAVGNYSIVVTSDQRADEIIVRNCYFHDAMAQILLLRGAKKGLVENNLLVRSAGPAVDIGFSVYWWEGPAPSHMVIRNNTILRNPVFLATPRNPACSICVHAGTMHPVAARLMHYITIDRNTIVDSASTAIYIRNADHVWVRNNTIINPIWSNNPLGRPVDGSTAAIDVDTVTSLAISGNQMSFRQSYCNASLKIGNDVQRARVAGIQAVQTDVRPHRRARAA